MHIVFTDVIRYEHYVTYIYNAEAEISWNGGCNILGNSLAILGILTTIMKSKILLFVHGHFPDWVLGAWCLFSGWLFFVLFQMIRILDDFTLSTQEARNLILEMAATCSHSSGRKWPPAFSCHRQPLAATCSHSSGRKWLQVAASGRQHSLVTGSHLQPLAATRVAASGHLTSTETFPHFPRLTHGNFSTFSAANPRKFFHIFRG